MVGAVQNIIIVLQKIGHKACNVCVKAIDNFLQLIFLLIKIRHEFVENLVPLDALRLAAAQHSDRD